MPSLNRTWASLLLVLISLNIVAYASIGDRNPTFQHCLRSCGASQCDPSQPPIAAYLRAFGWTCEADCKYQCAHSFTDNIREGSKWYQFYGKWPFYRLGPIQEPFSVLMSLGNLWINWRGVRTLRRRVRRENKLRKWLELAGWAQINTWIWSSVFHSRDTPFTERMDYFSATITVAMSLLYVSLRTLGLQSPNSTSRLVYPVVVGIALLVISHFSYLLSFPLGQFPYGYHTKFVVAMALTQNALWIIWVFSFKFRYPTLNLLGGRYSLSYPVAYPPHDPIVYRPIHVIQPLFLVVVTTLAMGLELFDFAPWWRVIDAHSLWHAATIPIASVWWDFFYDDAIEYEGAVLGHPPTSKTLPPPSSGATSYPVSADRHPGTPNPNLGLFGETKSNENINFNPIAITRAPVTPTFNYTPTFAKLAATAPPQRKGSPGRSPGKSPKPERQD